MALQVIQKKGPLRWSPPPIALAFAIEIDGERGDQVELPAEIRQRLERPDRPQPALYLKEHEQPREERELINIQTEASVPELLGDEEKKAPAAAEVEHRFRRRPLQFQILRADEVQSQPALHVRIFRVVLAGMSVIGLDF